MGRRPRWIITRDTQDGTFRDVRANGLFFVHKQTHTLCDDFKIVVVLLLIVLVLPSTIMGFYTELLRRGAVLVGLATVLAATPTPYSPPIVNLGYSQYEGTTLSSGVNQYLGMRYAAPPLGELRFRAPAEPLTTSGIQSATAVRFSPLAHL